jgi:hypothetical protein
MASRPNERSAKEWVKRRREKALLGSLARVDDPVQRNPATDDPTDEVEALRARVDALRGDLRALPDEEPPAEIWSAVERRVFEAARAPRSGAWRTASVASAAALLAAVATTLWHQVSDVPEETRSTGTEVRALVEESQRLERSLHPELADGRSKIRLGGGDRLRWQASREALVYRLGDIDDELTAVSLAPDADRARAARLWRERVELMQLLGDLERVEEWQAVRTVMF